MVKIDHLQQHAKHVVALYLKYFEFFNDHPKSIETVERLIWCAVVGEDGTNAANILVVELDKRFTAICKLEGYEVDARRQ